MYNHLLLRKWTESSSSNLIFQTWFFKNQVQMDRSRSKAIYLPKSSFFKFLQYLGGITLKKTCIFSKPKPKKRGNTDKLKKGQRAENMLLYTSMRRHSLFLMVVTCVKLSWYYAIIAEPTHYTNCCSHLVPVLFLFSFISLSPYPSVLDFWKIEFETFSKVKLDHGR